MEIRKLAWRNVKRNSRRSGVTIAAMSLALFVMVLYSGLLEGYIRGMERDVLDLEVGDIQITGEGYLDAPSLYTQVDDPDTLINSLESAGFQASRKLSAGGLVAATGSSSGASIIGINAAEHKDVSIIHERVAEGAWLQDDAPQDAVIGRRLAKILGVKVGDELVLLSQALDGSTANDLFTVGGILGPVSDGTDRAGIYITEGAFRSFMAMPTGAHQVTVRRPEVLPLAEAEVQVRAIATGVDVLTWRQLMPTVATMLDSSAQLIYIIFFIVYLAVGILILNAMLMAVFERIREFGVIKALGVSPGTVLTLILTESAIQVAIAVAIGLGLALPGMYYLTHFGVNVGSLGGVSAMGMAMPSIWYGRYELGTIGIPTIMLTTMAMMAALYPALKAALINPVTAMSHQ